MYTANCDGCNKIFELYDGFMALNEESAIIDSIVNDDSWSYLVNKQCYCPDCHDKEWNTNEDILYAVTKDKKIIDEII